MIPHPVIAAATAERRRRGLSQQAAAARAGISVSTLNGWECGGSPTFVKLQQYLDVLGFRLVAVPTAARPMADKGPPPIEEDHKWCPSCHDILPTSQFSTDRTRVDGLNWQCRNCCTEKYRRARQAAGLPTRDRPVRVPHTHQPYSVNQPGGDQ